MRLTTWRRCTSRSWRGSEVFHSSFGMDDFEKLNFEKGKRRKINSETCTNYSTVSKSIKSKSNNSFT